MYQALYRKWRPRTFDDVVGQEHVTDTLKNQIISGRLSHAYLFIGTRGTGKTSCAKILAKAVNCKHPGNGNPCNKCSSCLGIDDGSIMDVVELDAASNNGVDNVRALRDEAIFSPAIVKKRVYIIDEVHMLSSSAFNALLKILEEPPEHLLFILATTELHKVPATILSRCQRHSFKRIEPTSLAKRISYVADKENMRLEPNAADLLARLADGSLRDGLSLLDQCLGYDTITSENVLSAMGLVGNLRIAELLEAISKGDTGKAVSSFGTMWSDGKAPATLLSELGNLMRDILMTKVAPKGGSELLSGGFDRGTLDRFANSMTAEELICGIDSVQAHIGSLRDGRDPKTTAELCIVGLCEPQLGDNIGTLKKRIAKLEQLLENQDISPKDTVRKDISNKISEPAKEPVREIPALETAPSPEPEKTETEKPAFEEEPEAEPAIKTEENSCVHRSSDDVLKGILEVLKTSMLPGKYNAISSHFLSRSSLDGNTLTVGAPDNFVKGQIEQAQSFIKSAAEQVTGETILVKIVENKTAQAAGAEKLDGLSKFGNVKFE
ncbi:MAG: DNA polymerase III subunit gamma/tau [Firmicutes bacterium HGW-Firmicutes-16]|nr:MAG: DNA polymerase III subunit gamma/tau [Firmicutes bacterium HGW-Firmicutes-16]